MRVIFTPSLNLSYSGLEEFQQHEFEGYVPKPSKSVSEDTSNKVKESPDALLVKELVLDDKLEKKTVFSTIAKIEFVRAKQQEKPVRKPDKYAKMYWSQSSRGNQRNWNNQKSQQLGSDFVMDNKACFVCGSFDHVQANCNYHQREMVVSGNNYTRVNYNYSTKKACPSAHRNIAPRAILMKIGLRPLNTARPINIAHPKTIVYSARPMPKVVNTARLNSAVVNAVRANQRHNYVDAPGISKNLMEDMLPLGEEPKEEKLLVKELLKLMCDKKNSVLFTDTGCFVLSLDFKLVDESQVLFKVPRKNNMYSVDVKNIVPKESLTYLVAKATLDESVLWHRRLGHSGVLTRRMTKTTNEQGFISVVYEGKTRENLHTYLFACFLSQEEPKKIIQALKDPTWIEAMQEELLQFKWNKKDERGIVIRNKVRLVAQGYTQEEGIDYDEFFALVARIKEIRLFLAYASFKDFVVYQMDVKSSFLYGKIEEEVYVCQPPGFEDPEFPKRVYKRGQIDKTLFIKRVKSDILLVQVYVDDIIFGSTKKILCTEFEKLMHKKFQMSSI
ncbi:putative ribonuclease H-like domain-containing protein, partial [Tanacetum coccineum]